MTTTMDIIEHNSDFNWCEPHKQILILSVGPDRTKFSVHLDLARHHLAWVRRKYPEDMKPVDGNVIYDEIPNCTVETFSRVQDWLYTGAVRRAEEHFIVPEVLTILWSVFQLADELEMTGLCKSALLTIAEFSTADDILSPEALNKIWERDDFQGTTKQKLLDNVVRVFRASDNRVNLVPQLRDAVLRDVVLRMSTLPHEESEQRSSANYENDGSDGAIREDRNATSPKYRQVRPKSAQLSPLSRRRNVEERLLNLRLPELEEIRPEAQCVPAMEPSQPDNLRSATTKFGPAQDVRSKESRKRKRQSGIPLVNDFEEYQGPAQRRQRRAKSLGEVILPEPTAAEQIMFCKDLLSTITASFGYWRRFNPSFLYPLTKKDVNIVEYRKVVKTPIDLTTIRDRLDNGHYENAKQVLADIKLMFANCYAFNVEDSEIYIKAKVFEIELEKRFDNIKEWLKNSNVKVEPQDLAKQNTKSATTENDIQQEQSRVDPTD